MEGLYIRYRETSVKPEYQMVTVFNAGATSYVLTNLKKYTKYEFFLVPFYKTIEGRPSNVKLATTLEDVPSAAPETVHVGMINMTSAFVRWAPPPKSEQNGPLVGYKVMLFFCTFIQTAPRLTSISPRRSKSRATAATRSWARCL